MNDSEWRADIAEAITQYPLLQPKQDNGKNHLSGEIEVVNKQSGIYIDSYEVDLFYPEEYPFCFPKVVEKSKKIPRDLDRHIYPKDDNLCLAVPPEERLLCKYGITTLWFLNKVLVPRLAQEYLVNRGREYQKEYSHNSNGIWEYFMKEFDIDDPDLVLQFISKIVSYQLPKGFELCSCGSGKRFKKCHRNIVLKLMQLGNNYLSSTATYLREHKFIDKNIN